MKSLNKNNNYKTKKIKFQNNNINLTIKLNNNNNKSNFLVKSKQLLRLIFFYQLYKVKKK